MSSKYNVSYDCIAFADDCIVFNDLSQDPTLFNATDDDYQFEIYRRMRECNK